MSDTAHAHRWGRPEWDDQRPHVFAPGWHPGRILLMVLAFIVWWPLGLAVLFFNLGSRTMGCRSQFGENRWQDKLERLQWKMDRVRSRMEGRGFGSGRGFGGGSSGNRAFDEYKQDTLRRLEDEQAEFKGFLDRLRHAKDKAEFDQFMAEHRTRPTPPDANPPQG